MCASLIWKRAKRDGNKKAIYLLGSSAFGKFTRAVLGHFDALDNVRLDLLKAVELDKEIPGLALLLYDILTLRTELGLLLFRLLFEACR